MNQAIVQSSGGITLVGGAPTSAALFRMALQRTTSVVAADGGADRCLAQGIMPDAVVGDMDSISPAARDRIGADRLFPVPEQETTDFDKALRSVSAQFVLAIGFVGARIDHGLAVLTTLVQSPQPCLVLGPQDVVFHLPRRIDLPLRRGDRVSLFPMAPVTGHSIGLDWPINGLTLSPSGRIGTSNRATSGPVRITTEGPGLLCILPRGRLDQVIPALTDAFRADNLSR